MSKFIRKLNLFLFIPFVINAILIILLPADLFTFRPWETVLPNRLSFYGPFYPNQKVTMIAEGNLGHNTPYAYPRRVEFITDSFGYRYTKKGENDYATIIVGDSMLAGTGLTQKDILSEVLSQKLEQNVYPLAPSTLDRYFIDPRFRESPPQLLILQMVESHINRKIKPDLCLQSAVDRSSEQNLRINNRSSSMQAIRVFVDRFVRNPAYFANYINSKGSERRLLVGDEKILFYEPSLQMRSLDDIDRVVDELVACEERLNQMGIGFVFLPVPDKENVYFDLMPIELQNAVRQRPRNVYLRTLIDRLHQADIQVVDTLTAFENARSNELHIYQTDDTHWDAEGVRITADLIVDLLNVSSDR